LSATRASWSATRRALYARLKEIRALVVDPRIAAQCVAESSARPAMAMLVEFGSATAALRCAVEIQREMGTRNLMYCARRAHRVPGRHQSRRHSSLMANDIAGEGVNVAARLETLAEPGGICISATVHEHMRTRSRCRICRYWRAAGQEHLAADSRLSRHIGKDDQHANVATRSPPQQRSIRRRWLIAGIAVLGAMVVGVLLVLPYLKPAASPSAPSNSVAILPFTAPAGSPSEEQLATHLLRISLANLGRWRMARVASPGLAAAYKGKALDARAAGRELNVRYLVEGAIRPESDRVVVSIRLVDTSTGIQLWSDQNEVRKAAERGEREVLLLRSARRVRGALYATLRDDPNQPAAMKLLVRADANRCQFARGHP
jgi:TolB-like protein